MLKSKFEWVWVLRCFLRLCTVLNNLLHIVQNVLPSCTGLWSARDWLEFNILPHSLRKFHFFCSGQPRPDWTLCGIFLLCTDYMFQWQGRTVLLGQQVEFFSYRGERFCSVNINYIFNITSTQRSTLITYSISPLHKGQTLTYLSRLSIHLVWNFKKPSY